MKTTMPPRTTLPKPNECAVETLLVEFDRGEFSPSDRCLLCEMALVEQEAVVRVRDHLALIDYAIHRRCLEFQLKKAPVDGDTADKEFKRYQRKLRKRYCSTT